MLSSLCLAGILTGCDALGNDSTASDNGPMQTITVGANPNNGSATLYIAVDHGLFAAQHLTVTIVNTTGGAAAVPALQGGAYDITSSNDATAILARQKGVPLDFVADEISSREDTNTVDVPPNSPIKSIKDLQGKTIGVSSLYDPPYFALRTEMVNNGLDTNSVHWVTVSYTNAATYLKNHQVDATIETDPYRTQNAQAIGAVSVVNIFAANSGFANFPIAAYVTLDTFAKAHSGAIAAFQRAMVQAASLATADPAMVKAAVLKHTKISKAVAAVMGLPIYPADLDPNRLQRVVTMLQKDATPPLVPAGFSDQSMIIPLPTS
jgi:NitT/TauT family transport system substrate-binding protein